MSITSDQPRPKGPHRFQKGNQYGIKGRTPKVLTPEELLERSAKSDLRAAAKEFSGEALTTILSIMRNPDVGAQQRLTAAGMILDRGHGRARSDVNVTVDYYERLSDADLIRMITGKDIDPARIAQARGEGLVIEHNADE